jgi:hypothetical protein
MRIFKQGTGNMAAVLPTTECFKIWKKNGLTDFHTRKQWIGRFNDLEDSGLSITVFEISNEEYKIFLEKHVDEKYRDSEENEKKNISHIRCLISAALLMELHKKENSNKNIQKRIFR